MTYATLCQDCLAEVLLNNSDELVAADWGTWAGNSLCQCGGDVCDCPACVATLERLRAGCLDHKALGVTGPLDGMRWVPASGLRPKYANYVVTGA